MWISGETEVSQRMTVGKIQMYRFNFSTLTYTYMCIFIVQLCTFFKIVIYLAFFFSIK